MSESRVPTCRVLDVPLAVTDYDGAVACARRWAAEQGSVHGIAAAATDTVLSTKRLPGFRESLLSHDLILPDGMPLVWVMNTRLEHKLHDRVYGPTFMLRVLAATVGTGESHFFLGGTEQMLVALEKNLREKFPGLAIAGSYSPPFVGWDEAEDQRIFAMIRASGARYVWIGLGTPKQEHWVSRHRAHLPPAVYITVGAAFAFHAKLLKQAPPWMQKRGLEWLFRLCAEPRRLWRRYLIGNTLFLWYLFWDRKQPSATS